MDNMATYFAGADGKAPQNLSVGDYVWTRGGEYAILGVNPDGSYQSAKRSEINPYVVALGNAQLRDNPDYAASIGLTQEKINAASNAMYTGKEIDYGGGGGTKPTWDTADTTNTQTGTSMSGSSPVPNTQALIDQQAEAEKARRLQAAKSARDTLISNMGQTLNTNIAALDSTQAGIKSSYDNQRNRAAANSDIGALNYAQKAASLGIRGNAAMQPELFRNVGLQNALSALGQQEAGENASIDRERALLRTNYNIQLDEAQNKYASEVAAAGAEVELVRLAQQIQASKDEAAKQTAADTAAKQTALDTIGQYSNDYQAEINRRTETPDTSDDWLIPYLRSARQDKINGQTQAAAAAQQQDFENNLALARIMNSGSSGSGGSNAPTFAQLTNTLDDMYNSDLENNGELTPTTRQAIINYANAYGGQYSGQLLAKYGITAQSTQNTQNTQNTPIDPDTYVQGLKRSVGAQGYNVNQIRDNLATWLSEGRITQQGVAYILGQLGLS
jgi:hypothetical protein